MKVFAHRTQFDRWAVENNLVANSMGADWQARLDTYRHSHHMGKMQHCTAADRHTLKLLALRRKRLRHKLKRQITETSDIPCNFESFPVLIDRNAYISWQPAAGQAEIGEARQHQPGNARPKQAEAISPTKSQSTMYRYFSKTVPRQKDLTLKKRLAQEWRRQEMGVLSHTLEQHSVHGR